MNTAFCNGRYFFVEVRRDGIVLYELDDEKLAEPRPRASADALRLAEDFLHQAVEQAYSALLLAQTSYSPHLII
ncbi:hypothetical protein J2Z50_003027 [Ensifer mexicanus]|nr:hypothetical protein [Sinorhizobium mexicanum]